MTVLIIILIVLSVVLSFFVLIQNPKGGGLSAGNAGASNMFGVQRTTDVLEKGTWLLLGLIVVVTLISTAVGNSGSSNAVDSKIRQQIENTTAPAVPQALPGGNGAAPAGQGAPAGQSAPAGQTAPAAQPAN